MQVLILAAEGSADPVSLLLQYGPLGIFAALMALYTRSSIKREQEKADQAAQQVQDLNNFIRAELLPKQVEQTMLHKQVADVLEQAVQLITETKIRNQIQRGDDGGPPFNPGVGRG
jgi:hypothetical protein